MIYSHNLVLKSRSYCGPRIGFYGMRLYDCLYFRLGQFITKTLVFVRYINFLQIRNKKKVVLDWHFHFHQFCFFQQTAELMFYHLEFYRFLSILFGFNIDSRVRFLRKKLQFFRTINTKVLDLTNTRLCFIVQCFSLYAIISIT